MMTTAKPWELLPGIPPLEGPFADAFIAAIPDPETRAVATKLAKDGYAVIDFPDPEIETRAQRMTETLAPHFDIAGWRRRNARSNLRLQDAWQTDGDVRAVATNDRVLGLLETLYGRRPRPFQTLTFPVGSQQAAHADAVHFDAAPHGFMCGVWLALEDVDDDNGPLKYYPGSHRWPLYEPIHLGLSGDLSGERRQTVYEPLWQALVDKEGVEPERFHARRGKALIWAANLLHGGDVHRDLQRTRWSQVTHYFFDGCAYYTPMHSAPIAGEIAFRDDMTDISTGAPLTNVVAGRRLSQSHLDASRGQASGHIPDTFDPQSYLAANPDVAASGMNACEHFLMHGRFENRPLTPETEPSKTQQE